MTAEQIAARSEARIPALVRLAYATIGNELAELMDKAAKQPPAVFFREVEAAIERADDLYAELDQKPIQDELETAIGEAIIAGLKAK